jgi:hypothetical protein
MDFLIQYGGIQILNNRCGNLTGHCADDEVTLNEPVKVITGYGFRTVNIRQLAKDSDSYGIADIIPSIPNF